MLKSDADVVIGAAAEQTAKVKAQGSVVSGGGEGKSKRDKDKKFASGVAVALGFFENDVQAVVQTGAQIDANVDKG